LFILKERKPKQEMWFTLAGLCLVLTGGIIIGLLTVMFPT
jgi:glucose uptake protein GlcU